MPASPNQVLTHAARASGGRARRARRALVRARCQRSLRMECDLDCISAFLKHVGKPHN